MGTRWCELDSLGFGRGSTSAGFRLLDALGFFSM